MLIEYVGVDGCYVGCVVALDKGVVGWSQCNVEKDMFNKKRAIVIATGRATKGTKAVPRRYDGEDVIGNAVVRMRSRASKYYQDTYVSPTTYKLKEVP